MPNKNGHPSHVDAMAMAHDAMFTAMGRLGAAGDAAFAADFPAFVATVEADFRDEETAMEAIGYADLRSHREVHAKVLGALHHAQARVANGDILAGRDALRLLPQWFSAHLASMDMALLAALKAAAR